MKEPKKLKCKDCGSEKDLYEHIHPVGWKFFRCELCTKGFKDLKVEIEGNTLKVDVNVKTMKIKVLQLDNDQPDKNGDIMPTNAIVEFNEKVILSKNFSNNIGGVFGGVFGGVLGEANLVRENDCFYIHNIQLMEKLDYRLLKLLTPAIGGIMKKKENNVVKSFMINTVCLSTSKNADPNIKSIGEQINE